MGESAAFLSSPLATALAGLFGALWGSFLNVAIERVPKRESVVRPGSRCAACGAPVRALDNIPIVSYFVLRGRCRRCGAPFSARHPIVEFLALLLAMGLWWKVCEADPSEAVGVRLARFALYFAFGCTLITLAFIDLETKLLPDAITLPAIPIFFLAGFGAHDAPWLERLVGGAVGYLFFRLVADFYYYVLKREALGLGDAKLLALIGVVLGWRSLAFVVFMGGFLGALVSLPVALRSRGGGKLRHAQIPFGPFLAAAALAYLFAGRTLLQLWLGDS